MSDPVSEGMRVVETASLTLEPQTAAHAEAMFVVLSDPAIYEHENEPPRSLEWLRTRYAKLETRTSADGRDQWLNWVIRLPDGRPHRLCPGDRASGWARGDRV